MVLICLFINGIFTVAGKDLEDEQKESYGDAEWKERVEKWKNRQEKRGLVSNGGNDQSDDQDDDYLYVVFLFTLSLICY